MLTVDYRRLGLTAGDRVLDLGCGGGRHAFEAVKRGGRVVALDLDAAELKDVLAVLGAMAAAGEVPSDAHAGAVNGSALALPFPDGAFDRIIASEVMEHIGDDRAALRELARVVRPGGVIAITVPRWFPELMCWALSDDYHAPAAPGGHVRIYRRAALVERVRAAGLVAFAHHYAHGLHSPYWWLRCLVGVGNDTHPLVRAYHAVLVAEMTRRPVPLRVAEAALQPVIGKSLVLYARKPAEEPT